MKLGNLDEKTPLSIKIIVFLVAYNLLIVLLGGWKKLQILFITITGLPAILLTFVIVLVLSLVLLGLIYRTEWGRKLAIAINALVILSTVATILFAFGALLLNQDAVRLAKSTIQDLIIGVIGGLLYVTFFFGMLDISSLIVAGASIYYLGKYKSYFSSGNVLDKRILYGALVLVCVASLVGFFAVNFFSVDSEFTMSIYNGPLEITSNDVNYNLEFPEPNVVRVSDSGSKKKPTALEFRDFMKTLVKDQDIKNFIGEFPILGAETNCTAYGYPLNWKVINDKNVGIKICAGFEGRIQISKKV